jgi:lipoate-protein ligase B
VTLAVTFDAPVRYAEGTRIQEALLAARQEGIIPDTVLFLEHHPVITIGNRGRRQHLLAPEELLAKQGIDLAESARGGDVTYHGPGQLVMYPILHLGDKKADSHGYLNNLEEVAVRTAESFNVKAFRRDGMNGAWTNAGKIAAIGFRLKRWVSYHGMSFNVSGDLAGFKTIVPCGLVGERVCTLETHLGPQTPSINEVREAMANHFETVCERPLERYQAEGALPEVIAKCLGDSKR